MDINTKKPKVLNVDNGILESKKFTNKNIKVGITTGCFDIFHSGHIKSIKYAAENCDILFLLLNSDESIRKLKGNDRPINKLEFRLGVLEELSFIDYIVIFDDKDADPILKKMNFNIFFKGGDYDINILKKKFPKTEIILSNHIKGNSTSLIIDKINLKKNINFNYMDIIKTPIKNEVKKVVKGWGHEIWMVNNEKYCGKILHFDSKAKFSMHYHLNKDETWFVQKGEFIFRYINGDTAEVVESILKENDTIRIPPGLPHQLETEKGGDIIEISTQHFEEDSIRVWKGDSQLK